MSTCVEEVNEIATEEGVHPVYLHSRHDCKKPYSFWSFQIPPQEFCEKIEEKYTCKDCWWFNNGFCELRGTKVDPDTPACEDFEDAIKVDAEQEKEFYPKHEEGVWEPEDEECEW